MTGMRTKLIYPDDFINQIIQGDCLQILPDIPANSCDMILCDLPYGLTNIEWDRRSYYEIRTRHKQNRGALV